MTQVIQSQGKLHFHSRHPILDDIAKTLVNFKLIRRPDRDVHIYVGIHKYMRFFLPKELNVGIQTEQYFDDDGQKLWRHASKLKILRQACQYKVILDLSPANRSAYDFLPRYLRQRIVFGPYIFPDEDVEFQSSPTKELAFFGGVNSRRAQILQDLEGAQAVKTMENGIFGDALMDKIKDCFGILNLHHDDAVYSEYPRLLIAYLLGKPIYSEKLARPLVQGQHYLPIDAKLDETTAKTVFASFKQEFVTKHRLSEFLAIVDKDFDIFDSVMTGKEQ